MKRCLTFLSVIIGITSYGQTNTFPSDGNVGIGTLNPQAKLEVYNAEGHFSFGIYSDPHPGQGYAIKIGQGGLAVNGNAIFPSGYMGIGTIHPQAPLDVSTYISNGAIGTVLARQTEGDGAGPGTSLNVRAWGTQSNYNGKSFSLEHSFYGVKNSAINFYRGANQASGFITFETNNGNEQMRIDPSGNVGIGTSNPSQKLEVNGHARFAGEANAQNGFRVGNWAIGDNTNSAPWYGLGASNITLPGGQGNGAVQLAGFFGLNLQTAYGQMVMTTLGNVGIGTTNPQQKLAVNGTIQAKEVKVTTSGWPDYVFQPEHKLPSLEILATQIKEQGHLPNIPSAEEVSKNGIALGEMNKKLLEKVEELTLYAIQQDTESKKLKAKSTQQKELLQTQSEDIKQLKELLLKQNERIEQLEQLVSQSKAASTK